MDKSSDAFRTISEVAADLDLPQHVLRFWETRFAQIKPLKRGGGRRYYRPDDVDLLRGIRHLLYGEGYTIRGVQRILKEQGVRFVMTLWQEGAPGLEEVRRQDRGEPDTDFGEGELDYGEDSEPAVEAPAEYASAQPRLLRGQARALQPAEKPRAQSDPSRTVSLVPIDQRAPREAEPLRGWQPDDAEEAGGDDPALYALAQRFAPTGPTSGPTTPTSGLPSAQPMFPRTAAPVTARDVGESAPVRSSLAPLIDRLRPGHGRSEAEAESAPGDQGGLSRDDVRRLQATLFELLECKRLLDQAR